MLYLIFMFELSILNGIQEQYLFDDKCYGYYDQDNTLFVTFNCNFVLADIIFVNGAIKILTYSSINEFNFWPTGLSSYFEGGFIWKGLSIGYRHFCIHPTIPFLMIN